MFSIIMLGDLMKIIKIDKMPSGKYKIVIDDEKIITYDDVIIKNGLLFKKDIDKCLYTKIKEDTLYYDQYNKVLKLIDKKVRSEKEIREYLIKQNSDNYVEDIINKLKNNRLLDDERFCKAYVSDKIYLSLDGPNKIRKDLESHNIDNYIIENALKDFNDEIIYDRLYKIIGKKIKSNHKYSRSILKEKIVSYIIDLGYPKDIAINIFDELYVEDNSIIEKEASKIYKQLSRKYSGDELKYKFIAKMYSKGFRKDDIDKLNY